MAFLVSRRELMVGSASLAAISSLGTGSANAQTSTLHVTHFGGLCMPKTRFCNIGDEVRRGQAVM
jgi:hypothetical protein